MDEALVQHVIQKDAVRIVRGGAVLGLGEVVDSAKQARLFVREQMPQVLCEPARARLQQKPRPQADEPPRASLLFLAFAAEHVIVACTASVARQGRGQASGSARFAVARRTARRQTWPV